MDTTSLALAANTVMQSFTSLSIREGRPWVYITFLRVLDPRIPLPAELSSNDHLQEIYNGCCNADEASTKESRHILLRAIVFLLFGESKKLGLKADYDGFSKAVSRFAYMFVVNDGFISTAVKQIGVYVILQLIFLSVSTVHFFTLQPSQKIPFLLWIFRFTYDNINQFLTDPEIFEGNRIYWEISKQLTEYFLKTDIEEVEEIEEEVRWLAEKIKLDAETVQ